MYTSIPTDEAIRRIQERDHAQAGMALTFEYEELLIHGLREGILIGGIDPETNVLAFTPVPKER